MRDRAGPACPSRRVMWRSAMRSCARYRAFSQFALLTPLREQNGRDHFAVPAQDRLGRRQRGHLRQSLSAQQSALFGRRPASVNADALGQDGRETLGSPPACTRSLRRTPDFRHNSAGSSFVTIRAVPPCQRRIANGDEVRLADPRGPLPHGKPRKIEYFSTKALLNLAVPYFPQLVLRITDVHVSSASANLRKIASISVRFPGPHRPRKRSSFSS